jgi:hypothetical protein|nr:MAG TPA_asm: hypothetical protein [Caudoviricetes sp.]
MKGYKAFSKGMVCRGKQYAENSTFEEAGAETCCREGMMHFCETPFDCLDYYPLVDKNGELIEIAEVEALDKVVCEENKRASKKIKIGAKLSFRDFVKIGIQCIIESTKPSTSGNYAKIGSSGDGAQIGSSGDDAKIGSSGNDAQISSSGDRAVVSAIGVKSMIKAKIGSWITLAEYDEERNPICVKSAMIDGENLLPNIFYILRNGEFVPVPD